MAKKFREEEKKMMKKEEEKKESMVAADEAEKAEAKKEAADPEADPEHADVAKDKELILSMIKKYMGKGEEEECAEGEMEAAHEAYEAYCEMGEDEDEAMKYAGKSMKLAKYMADKRMKASEGEEKKAEAEKCEDESEDEAKHSEVVPMSPKADPEKYEAKKESEIKLVAKIAMLERQVKTYELAAILDKKLKECGLGRAETDKIRECIGTPKSESHIVDTIKIFKEAFSVRGSESVAKDASFFVTMERSEGGKVEGKVDFSKF